MLPGRFYHCILFKLMWVKLDKTLAWDTGRCLFSSLRGADCCWHVRVMDLGCWIQQALLGEGMLAMGRMLDVVTVDRTVVTGATGDRKRRAEFKVPQSREREVKPFAAGAAFILVGVVGYSLR